jgi:hypothetical protein
MLVHSVYFWLKPELTPAQVEEFVRRGTALTRIGTVKHGWFGKPSTTDRPVIDRSYSFALTVVFDDLAGHDAYQIDPIHHEFLELKDYWTKVLIYDAE